MTWVIEYDCGECQIIKGISKAEAFEYLDDLGCTPIEVYAPNEVILRGDPWTKNGQLRCVIDRKILGHQIVKEARKYLDVPYYHCGRNVHGLDCLGLVLVVAHDLKLTDWDIKNYTENVDCYMLREGIERFCVEVPVEDRKPGDVLLFSMKGQPQHIGFSTDVGVIHSHQAAKRVVEHRISILWERRLVAAFRWREG